MAREGRSSSPQRGYRHSSGARRIRPQHGLDCKFCNRQTVSRRTGPLAPPEEPGRAAARRCTAAYCFAAALVAGTSTIALLPSAGAATEVTSARVWPAQEYTRITLEANVPIKHTLFSVKDPERLVLDLEEVEFNGQLQSLIAKVGAGDPYIKSVRIGRFRPGVVRVVLDLKEEAKPQVFML